MHSDPEFSDERYTKKKEKCFIESIKEDTEMKIMVPLREKDCLHERDEGKNFQFANGRSC